MEAIKLDLRHTPLFVWLDLKNPQPRKREKQMAPVEGLGSEEQDQEPKTETTAPDAPSTEVAPEPTPAPTAPPATDVPPNDNPPAPVDSPPVTSAPGVAPAPDGGTPEGQQ